MSQFISVGNVLRKAKGIIDKELDKDLATVRSGFAQLPSAANFTSSDFKMAKEIMNWLKQIDTIGNLTDKQTDQLGKLKADLRTTTLSAQEYRDAPTSVVGQRRPGAWKVGGEATGDALKWLKEKLGLGGPSETEKRRKLMADLPSGQFTKIKPSPDRTVMEKLAEKLNLPESTSSTEDVGTKLKAAREKRGPRATKKISKEAMESQGKEGFWKRWVDPLRIASGEGTESIASYKTPPRGRKSEKSSGPTALERLMTNPSLSKQERENQAKMKRGGKSGGFHFDTGDYQKYLKQLYYPKPRSVEKTGSSEVTTASKGLYIPADRELRKAAPGADRLKTVQNYLDSGQAGRKALLGIIAYLKKHGASLPEKQRDKLLGQVEARFQTLEEPAFALEAEEAATKKLEASTKTDPKVRGKLRAQLAATSPSRLAQEGELFRTERPKKPTPPFLKTDVDSTDIEAAHKTFSTWAKDKGLATISKDGKLVPTAGKELSIIDKYLASGEGILPAFRDYLTKQGKPSKVTEDMGYRPGMSIFNQSPTQVASSWGTSSAGRKANIKGRSIKVGPTTGQSNLAYNPKTQRFEPRTEVASSSRTEKPSSRFSGKAPSAVVTPSRTQVASTPRRTDPSSLVGGAINPAQVRQQRGGSESEKLKGLKGVLGQLAAPTEKPTTLARSVFVSVDQSLKKACDIKGAIDHLLADWKERNPDTVAGRYYHDLKETAQKHGMSKGYQIWAETEALMKADMSPEALALMKDTEIKGYLNRWYPKDVLDNIINTKLGDTGDLNPDQIAARKTKIRADIYQSTSKKLGAGKAGGLAIKYKKGEGVGPLLAPQLAGRQKEGTSKTAETSTASREGGEFFKKQEGTGSQWDIQRLGGTFKTPPPLTEQKQNPMNVQLAQMRKPKPSTTQTVAPSTRSATPTTTEQPSTTKPAGQ